MKIRSAFSVLMILALVSGVAVAANPGVDTSQPSDPQPAGGPTGDGEDWAGDGRAPVTDNDPLDDREGVERRLRGPQREPVADSNPTDDDVGSKDAKKGKRTVPNAPSAAKRPASPAGNSAGTR